MLSNLNSKHLHIIFIENIEKKNFFFIYLRDITSTAGLGLICYRYIVHFFSKKNFLGGGAENNPVRCSISDQFRK